MKLTTLSFAGSELDVFIGHKDFELLFIAKQVADCAGLKNPSHAIWSFLKGDSNKKAIKVKDLNNILSINERLSYHPSTWMIDESTAYRLLLQGHAPQSEPFRKWVTEEVLPSIRKTGSYDLAKSETPEAKLMAESFESLKAEIQNLSSEVKSLHEVIANLQLQTTTTTQIVKSPYEGDIKRAVCTLFDKKAYRDCGDSMGLSFLVLDKITSIAMIRAEHKARKLWDDEDGRPLDSKVSMRGRDWQLFPEKWLKSKMTRSFYRDIINQAVEASMQVVR